MTAHFDELQRWQRRAHFERHRQLSGTRGWRAFVRSMLFWWAIGVGFLGALGMLAGAAVQYQAGFTVVLVESESEAGAGTVLAAALVALVALAFGAMCALVCRSAQSKRRWSERATCRTRAK